MTYRSVLKSGVRVSQSLQAIKLFQITRFLTLNKFRTWQPVVPHLCTYIAFYLPFLTQIFHFWWCEICRVTQQQFWMKGNIFFRGGVGVVKTLWSLLHIFRGSWPRNPQDLRPGTQSIIFLHKIRKSLHIFSSISEVLCICRRTYLQQKSLFEAASAAVAANSRWCLTTSVLTSGRPTNFGNLPMTIGLAR